jgi:hypothetical protein
MKSVRFVAVGVIRVAMTEREFHCSCALGIEVVLVLWEGRRCERRGEVTGQFSRGGGPWALVSLWLRSSLRELESVLTVPCESVRRREDIRKLGKRYLEELSIIRRRGRRLGMSGL